MKLIYRRFKNPMKSLEPLEHPKSSLVWFQVVMWSPGKIWRRTPKTCLSRTCRATRCASVEFHREFRRWWCSAWDLDFSGDFSRDWYSDFMGLFYVFFFLMCVCLALNGDVNQQKFAQGNCVITFDGKFTNLPMLPIYQSPKCGSWFSQWDIHWGIFIESFFLEPLQHLQVEASGHFWQFLHPITSNICTRDEKVLEWGCHGGGIPSAD